MSIMSSVRVNNANNLASTYTKGNKPVDKILQENTSFLKINLILK